MTKERKFYDALKDVFVGAKIEGESGYINLMKIKSRYYEEGVFLRLKEDIEDALKPFPDFREELFDKLYTFFSRYFSESGSIYFRYTPLHQNIYEKVYTDDKDVMLFWKTHILYYVKTDRLFRNLEVEMDDVKFFFDVSTLEHKKANEKREIIYEFKEKRRDGTLVFIAAYSERGQKTKLDDIQRTLRREGVKVEEETLEQAFRVFERQSEVDYFINKNAKAFLQEQFNLWLYQYVFSGESEWTENRIKQLQALKDIAYKIIDFISQFEDELVKIWNKPKFALNSNYVITLDRIAERDIRLVERLLDHENFQEQVEEWQALGIVDSDFNKEVVIKQDLLGKRLNDAYRYLPIDTKYFKDLELDILGLFDNLDEALDGWLIKSENYQALNTILPKFKENVQMIYIDPPYNTGSDEFIYKDKFQHSSWIAMMDNRLSLAKELMCEDGSFFSSIDDNEVFAFKKLLDEIFNNTNFIANLIWRKRAGGGSDSKFISTEHEYILCFSKNSEKCVFNRFLPKDKNYPFEDESGRFTKKPLHNPRLSDSSGLHYNIKCPDGKILKGSEHQWVYSEETFKRLLNEGKIIFEEKKGNWKVYYKIYRDETQGAIPYSILYSVALNSDGVRDLKELGLSGRYDYPKPSELITYLLRIATQKEGMMLDFFAGSGTTAHAIMKLNKEDKGKRKFILVEMADYFETIIIPRLKKIACSFNWKDGKPQDSEGIGIFFKYYQLEQYENTLRKAKYEDSDLFENPYQEPYNQYVFLRDLKMLEALEVDMKQNKVRVELSKLYEDIDIAETLSNLTGKRIKKITADCVEFEDGEILDIKNLDWRRIKPLVWW